MAAVATDEAKTMHATKAKLETSENSGIANREEYANHAYTNMTIALVDWSHLLEDYLDNIGISFESFCNEMSGGWMFGYIDALKTAGIRTVLFCVSARVKKPTRFRHRATGATICVLPAPKIYRALRRRVLNPYAATVEEAVGDVRGIKKILWSAVKDFAPYHSTPLVHLARELRRERCDAILCQDYEHGRFDVCLLLGRLIRLPVFATFQGGDLPLSRLEPLARRFFVNLCNGLIIATGREAERVKANYEISREQVEQIFNPLDLSEWYAEDKAKARAALKIPQSARVAVWHGRVQIQIKGLDVLLEAWERVCRERAGSELRLLLVGTGNDRDELRQRIARLNVQNVIWIDEYVLERARLRSMLSTADVYVLSSRREGFPVAPVEAMACKLPVVAVNAPGIADIFDKGEQSGGIVVPQENITVFATELGRLLDNKVLSAKMGERARANAEGRFSPEAVGRSLRDFMEKRNRQVKEIKRKS